MINSFLKVIKIRISTFIRWVISQEVEQLPFFIIFLGLIITLILEIIFVRLYWYDEMIVTNISYHDLKGILETISSEPHPVGIYLFLKLFNVENVVQTKLFSTITYYLLIILITAYAYKENTLKEYKLSVGLALFFSSGTHFLISSDIKQDILSFPILYLLFILSLNILKTNGENSPKIIVYSSFLTFSLLFIGYHPYVLAMGLLLFQVVLSKEKLKSLILFFFQLFVLGVYYFLFLGQQIINNSGRMGWISRSINHPLIGLATHLVGFSINNYLAILLLLAFLSFLFFYIYKRHNGIKNKYEIYIVLAACILVVFSWITRSFVRPRYSALLYLLLSIMVGWGLLSTFKHKTKFIYIIVTSFFIIDFSMYAVGVLEVQSTIIYEKNTIDEFVKNDRALILGDHPIEPFLFKVDRKEENLIPVSVYYPGLFDNTEKITKKHLLVIGNQTKDLSETETLKILRKYNTGKVVYLMEHNSEYYDSENRVLHTLMNKCTEYRKKEPFYILFTDCMFN